MPTALDGSNGDSWNSDAIASFFSSSEEDEDAEDPAARARFPRPRRCPRQLLTCRESHHHHHRRHHHHRFVLVLARGKRLSVFSARRSDERGIIRVRRGESCQRRHPRAIRAPNTPRPFPESEVTPFFFCFFPGKLGREKKKKK